MRLILGILNGFRSNEMSVQSNIYLFSIKSLFLLFLKLTLRIEKTKFIKNVCFELGMARLS